MRPILAGVHCRRQSRSFSNSAAVPEETTVTAVTIPPIHHAPATPPQSLTNSAVNNCQPCRGMQHRYFRGRLVLEKARGSWVLIHLESSGKKFRKRENALQFSTVVPLTIDSERHFYFHWLLTLFQINLGVWSHFAAFFSVVFNILKQVPIYFHCLGECCSDVLLWGSRKVLWTKKLHQTFP